MKLLDVKERWLMCWLMFMGRGVTQAVRVVLGALMPFIAADLDLDHQEKGTVLAAFAAMKGINAPSTTRTAWVTPLPMNMSQHMSQRSFTSRSFIFSYAAATRAGCS